VPFDIYPIMIPNGIRTNYALILPYLVFPNLSPHDELDGRRNTEDGIKIGEAHLCINRPHSSGENPP
jgi:hypothetical protein